MELPRQDSFGELTAGVPALHSATNGRIRRKRYGTTGPRRGCRRGLPAFGSGTLSSSDGQKFPVKGKSLTAAHLSRYFARGQGVSAYTHVSDQHSTYAAKVIAATSPESPNVLDGILGNQTDLPATEHATDTHGATLANFALFDLVDFQFSPRIRDLGKITLYRPGPRADFTARYPTAPTPSTSTANSPSSTPTGTGRCAAPHRLCCCKTIVSQHSGARAGDSRNRQAYECPNSPALAT